MLCKQQVALSLVLERALWSREGITERRWALNLHLCNRYKGIAGSPPSDLVAWTQLVDSQDLSGAESLSEQVNCPHLSAEHAVGVRRLGRAQETLVKRLEGTSKTRNGGMGNI